MKKQGFLLVVSIMCLALMTGCSSNADVMPSPAVTTAPTTAPVNTAGPTATVMPANTAGTDGMMDGLLDGMTPDMGANAGVNSVEDALRVSDRVSEEVAKLSELDSADAVVAGNIALVGVSYDKQYQGGLTERLREMVTERAESVDKAITAVHVSDEEDVVMKISQLREKLKSDDVTFQQLQTQVLDIGSSITGGGSPQIAQPQSSTGT